MPSDSCTQPDPGGYPSLITLARDGNLRAHSGPSQDPEDIPNSEDVLCTSMLWEDNTWKLRYDGFMKNPIHDYQDTAESHISAASLYSDCIIFMCGHIDVAVSMYLAWLNQCSNKLPEKRVKPTAYIAVVDSPVVSVDNFIRKCSSRIGASGHDSESLKSEVFETVQILRHDSETLRRYSGISLDYPCIPWIDIEMTYLRCRRVRQDSGKLWSRKNLLRLYNLYDPQEVPPNAVEALTAKFPIRYSIREAAPGETILADGSSQLDLFVVRMDAFVETLDHAVPVIASMLAMHATRSLHWSNKIEFLTEHFEKRYQDCLEDFFSKLLRQRKDCVSQGYHRDSLTYTTTSSGYSCSAFLSLVREQWTKHIQHFAKCRSRYEIACLHVRMIRQHKAYLNDRPFDTQCVSCVVDPWSVLLPCSHGLCNLCLEAAGTREADGHQIQIEDCPVCHFVFTGPSCFPIEPRTAAGRVLALDGGGVRGIVQLEILRLLEERIGLDIPLTSFFDLIVGTSIGGICALGLGKSGWTIRECKDKFLLLTKRVFSELNSPERFLARITNGWYKTIRSAIKILLTDSLYDTNVIEQVLQDAFGSCSTMLSPRTHFRAPKVAVVVDEASSSTCKILPTYNKAGHSQGKQYRWPSRYSAFRVWEAGRCTSAAPSYWRPKELYDEVYQDGGLDWNNPLSIAWQEGRTLFPRNSEKNVIVSVGCGKTRNAVINRKSFFWRLLQSYLTKLDAGIQDDNIALYVPNRHRLDPFLGIAQVHLNDCASIPALQDAILDTVRLDHVFQESINKTSKNLLASLFYFELRTNKRVRGQSSKSLPGSVLSRLSPSEVKVFQAKYCDVRFKIAERSFPMKIPMDVRFTNISLREEFHIKLQFGKELYSISGSPFTIERLQEAQQDFLPMTNIYNQKRKLSST